jgi:hypothetical protein
MDSVQENITVPSEISSSYSVAEIEPEKTVADAQLALMRLRAITAAYVQQKFTKDNAMGCFDGT